MYHGIQCIGLWHSLKPSLQVQQSLPLSREKEEKEVNHCHPRDGRGEAAVQGQCRAFPWSSAYSLMLTDRAAQKRQVYGILFSINWLWSKGSWELCSFNYILEGTFLSRCLQI